MAATGNGPRARRTQAQRRQESERRLLNVTARLVAERGTAGASFTEIADAAGCSRSLPHYLFGTKVAMLERLAEHAAEQFLQSLLGDEIVDKGGLVAIEACLDVFIRSLQRPWPLTRAVHVLIAEALGSVPELKPTLDRHHEQIRQHIGRWLQEGIERGEIRPGIDTDAQATAILATMRGIGIQVLAQPDLFDVDRLAAEIVGNATRSLSR